MIHMRVDESSLYTNETSNNILSMYMSINGIHNYTFNYIICIYNITT